MAEPTVDVVGAALRRIVATSPGPEVVDIGGGSGARAVPLAQLGCRVTVVDVSTDALASLARRAAEAGVSDRITALQADADQVAAVVGEARADLVLHHHLMQDLDDPGQSLGAAVQLLRPGGYLSVLVPGRLSAVLASALAGNYPRARTLMEAREGLFDVPSLRELMTASGAMVESITGIGVATTLSGGRLDSRDDPALAELEAALGRHPVLGQIGGELHGLGRRSER